MMPGKRLSVPRSSLLFLLWLVTSDLEVMAESLVCFQCATHDLKANWAVTGLPFQPTTLYFDESTNCSKPEKDTFKNPKYVSGNCVSSCFEIILPLNDDNQYVRGCHADFVWEEFQVTNSNSCYANPVAGTENKNLYAGVAFSAPVEASKDLENTKFSDGSLTTFSTDCPPEQTHTCKSCSEYNGGGTCPSSTTGTCTGAFCTKTEGRLNGDYYVTRGCASFNPIGRDVCSWTDQVINLTIGADTAAASARKKRAISMVFQANQCYCQGELCNSSSRLSAFLLSIFSASFLVVL